MKMKRILSVSMLCVMALMALCVSACRRGPAYGIDVPEDAFQGQDGIWERDVFEEWFVSTGQVGGSGFPAMLWIGPYALGPLPEGVEVTVRSLLGTGTIESYQPMSKFLGYYWKPHGMEYTEWLLTIPDAKTEKEADALKALDYVSCVIEQDGHIVSYQIWLWYAKPNKYFERDEDGNLVAGWSGCYTERFSLLSREFPKVNGEYQDVRMRDVNDRIDTYVEKHYEAIRERYNLDE